MGFAETAGSARQDDISDVVEKLKKLFSLVSPADSDGNSLYFRVIPGMSFDGPRYAAIAIFSGYVAMSEKLGLRYEPLDRDKDYENPTEDDIQVLNGLVARIDTMLNSEYELELPESLFLDEFSADNYYS